MSSRQQPEPVGPLAIYNTITTKLAEYGSNASNNIANGVNNMTPQSWIRLVVIVGGYMLMRQYVIRHSKGVAVRKLKQQQAEEKAQREQQQAEAAKLSPNELRGLGAGAGAGAGAEGAEDPDADEHAEGTGVDWGSRARTRQRKFVREMLEAEERRKLEEQEDEDDEDIKEFLID